MTNWRGGFLFAATAAGLLLGGCVNLAPTPDRVREAALGPLAPLDADASGGAEAGAPLYVARPALPEYLRGKHLAYREADGTLSRLSGVRWAEPLAEGVARAVGEFLLRREGIAVSGYYPWPRGGSGERVLELRFFRLGAQAGSVRLRADWTVRESGGILAEGRSSVEPVAWDGSAEGYLEGWNRVLDTLAGEVAAALRERGAVRE